MGKDDKKKSGNEMADFIGDLVDDDEEEKDDDGDNEKDEKKKKKKDKDGLSDYLAVAAAGLVASAVIGPGLLIAALAILLIGFIVRKGFDYFQDKKGEELNDELINATENNNEKVPQNEKDKLNELTKGTKNFEEYAKKFQSMVKTLSESEKGKALLENPKFNEYCKKITGKSCNELVEICKQEKLIEEAKKTDLLNKQKEEIDNNKKEVFVDINAEVEKDEKENEKDKKEEKIKQEDEKIKSEKTVDKVQEHKEDKEIKDNKEIKKEEENKELEKDNKEKQQVKESEEKKENEKDKKEEKIKQENEKNKSEKTDNKVQEHKEEKEINDNKEIKQEDNKNNNSENKKNEESKDVKNTNSEINIESSIQKGNIPDDFVPSSLNDVRDSIDSNNEEIDQEQDGEGEEQEAPEASGGVGSAILGGLKTVGKAIWSGIKFVGKGIGKGIARLALGKERYEQYMANKEKEEAKTKDQTTKEQVNTKSANEATKNIEKATNAISNEDKQNTADNSKDSEKEDKDKKDKDGISDYLSVAAAGLVASAVIGPALLIAALAILLVGLIVRKGFDYFQDKKGEELNEELINAAENNNEKVPQNEKEKLNDLTKGTKNFEEYANKLQGFIKQASQTEKGKVLLEGKAFNSMCQQYFGKTSKELVEICNNGKLIEEAKKTDLLIKEQNEKIKNENINEKKQEQIIEDKENEKDNKIEIKEDEKIKNENIEEKNQEQVIDNKEEVKEEKNPEQKDEVKDNNSQNNNESVNEEPKEIDKANIEIKKENSIQKGSISDDFVADSINDVRDSIDSNNEEIEQEQDGEEEEQQEEAPEASGVGSAILGGLKTVGKAIWSGIKFVGKGIGKGIARLALGKERYEKYQANKAKEKANTKTQTTKEQVNTKSANEASKNIEKVTDAISNEDKGKNKTESKDVDKKGEKKESEKEKKEKEKEEDTKIKAGLIGFTASMIAFGAPVTLAIVALIALIGLIRKIWDLKNDKSEPENAMEGAQKTVETVAGKEKTPSLEDCLAFAKDKDGKPLSKEEFINKAQSVISEFAKTDKGKELLNNPSIINAAKNILGIDLSKGVDNIVNQIEQQKNQKEQIISNEEIKPTEVKVDNTSEIKKGEEINPEVKKDSKEQIVIDDEKLEENTEVKEQDVLNINEPVNSESLVDINNTEITSSQPIIDDKNFEEFEPTASRQDLIQEFGGKDKQQEELSLDDILEEMDINASEK